MAGEEKATAGGGKSSVSGSGFGMGIGAGAGIGGVSVSFLTTGSDLVTTGSGLMTTGAGFGTTVSRFMVVSGLGTTTSRFTTADFGGGGGWTTTISVLPTATWPSSFGFESRSHRFAGLADTTSARTSLAGTLMPAGITTWVSGPVA